MEYLLNDFAGIGQVQWTQNPAQPQHINS